MKENAQAETGIAEVAGETPEHKEFRLGSYGIYGWSLLDITAVFWRKGEVRLACRHKSWRTTNQKTGHRFIRPSITLHGLTAAGTDVWSWTPEPALAWGCDTDRPLSWESKGLPIDRFDLITRARLTVSAHSLLDC